MSLNLLLVELVKIAEVFLKRASLLQQQVEVLLTDDDIMSLSRNIHFLILLPHTAVMLNLGIVGKSLHNNKSKVSKCHGLQLEVLNHKRVEVVLSHLIEQLVRRSRVGREHQHKILRLVASLLEWSKFLVGIAASGVVRQSHRPQHAAGVA